MILVGVDTHPWEVESHSGGIDAIIAAKRRAIDYALLSGVEALRQELPLGTWVVFPILCYRAENSK